MTNSSFEKTCFLFLRRPKTRKQLEIHLVRAFPVTLHKNCRSLSHSTLPLISAINAVD